MLFGTFQAKRTLVQSMTVFLLFLLFRFQKNCESRTCTLIIPEKGNMVDKIYFLFAYSFFNPII